MEAQSLSTCNQCGKKFQRKAHLLRHQQQHSGDRPYSCQFCSKTFKRSDVLRDHFSRCDKRGSNEIPSSLERGRKRHACNECSRLKVKCDNETPCRKCREFGRTCVKNHSTAASSPDTTASVGSRTTPTSEITGSDRNSIGFLLNCPGETDFMREFPKDNTLGPNGKPMELTNLMALHDVFLPKGPASGPAPAYNEYGQVPVDPTLENFLSHLEFATFEEQTQNFPGPAENMILWSGPDMVYLDRAVLDQRAFNIREKLKYTAMTMNVPHSPPKEVLEAIEWISANKIAFWIKLYFRHWHKHGPIVHEATFNPCTAALPLVLASMSLGGMYSHAKEDVDKLKVLLDTIEAFVYSMPRLSEEYDLPDRTYVNHREDSSLEWQRFQLEELQGAYLVIVLQYWTGNPIARTRVRQQRYGRVVAIMHHLEMQTVQHSPNFIIKDQPTFQAWIMKESYVRTATMATMLDSAFGIFNNVSPRFQWAELDLCFPCDDTYFRTSSWEELLSTQRFPVLKMKIKDAFLVLFDNREGELRVLSEARLTALDMQVLIHYLYTHTWTTLFCNPLISIPNPNSPNLITDTVAPFRTAMRNWKTIWDSIRAAAPAAEWEKLGFQRTAETYYDAVRAIVEVWERRGGRFPPLKSDCEKGTHLKRLLTF